MKSLKGSVVEFTKTAKEAQALNQRLKVFSNQGKSLFLVDAKESLADWAIWPFVRQFRIADIIKIIKLIKNINTIHYLNPKFLAAALPALITLLFSNSSVLPQRIQIK